MQYVYSANDGIVANNVSGGSVYMRVGDVWFGDDPFVLARPELFSAEPVVIHSTTGRQAPEYRSILTNTATAGPAIVLDVDPEDRGDRYPYRRRERQHRG